MFYYESIDFRQEKNMRHLIISIATLFVFTTALPVLAGTAHQAGGHSGGSHSSEHSHSSGSSHGATGGMKSDSSMSGMRTFKHQAVVDGIQAEFQVMSLASMNVTDPGGRTHHIMVKLNKEGMDHPIADAVGKIKVIAPDKKEQIGVLKHYGDLMAANFTFDAPGKYGVICLFKENGQKHVVKFWYPHEE
jgi:hypothetical protein